MKSQSIDLNSVTPGDKNKKAPELYLVFPLQLGSCFLPCQQLPRTYTTGYFLTYFLKVLFFENESCSHSPSPLIMFYL